MHNRTPRLIMSRVDTKPNDALPATTISIRVSRVSTSVGFHVSPSCLSQHFLISCPLSTSYSTAVLDETLKWNTATLPEDVPYSMLDSSRPIAKRGTYDESIGRVEYRSSTYCACLGVPGNRLVRYLLLLVSSGAFPKRRSHVAP
jgi:hypothetical protein